MDTQLVKNSEAVTFTDLVLLCNIVAIDCEDDPATRDDLIRENIVFFEHYNITEERGRPIDNSYTFQLHIEKLRDFGLVDNKSHFHITEKGERLVNQLVSRPFHVWPLSIPYIDGTFRMEEAFYLGE